MAPFLPSEAPKCQNILLGWCLRQSQIASLFKVGEVISMSACIILGYYLSEYIVEKTIGIKPDEL